MTRTSTHELTLRLSIDDVNLMLEGLGNLPFNRVFALIGHVQAQVAPQLRADAPADDEAPAGPLAMVASR